MTRAKYTDETEAVPSRIKRGLDERILEEYVLTFRDSRKDRDGRPIPEDVVWANLADTLCIDGTTRWRFVKGVDGTGSRPLSPFDGQPERYRPGIEEVFRYIAAADLNLESIRFPRGRVMVNRAMARALSGLRRITTGEDRSISDVELERLRFLERWNRQHMTRSGFSAQTVRDMLNENRENLMGEIEFSDQFVRSLNQLFADWTVHHARLLNNLPYDWLRG